MNSKVLTLFPLFWGLCIFVSPAFAADNAPFLTEIPGGALLGNYTRLTIPESGGKLSEALSLDIDELVINGTLVTNGYRTRINTRKITNINYLTLDTIQIQSSI